MVIISHCQQRTRAVALAAPLACRDREAGATRAVTSVVSASLTGGIKMWRPCGGTGHGDASSRSRASAPCSSSSRTSGHCAEEAKVAQHVPAAVQQRGRRARRRELPARRQELRVVDRRVAGAEPLGDEA